MGDSIQISENARIGYRDGDSQSANRFQEIWNEPKPNGLSSTDHQKAQSEKMVQQGFLDFGLDNPFQERSSAQRKPMSGVLYETRSDGTVFYKTGISNAQESNGLRMERIDLKKNGANTPQQVCNEITEADVIDTISRLTLPVTGAFQHAGSSINKLARNELRQLEKATGIAPETTRHQKSGATFDAGGVKNSQDVADTLVSGAVAFYGAMDQAGQRLTLSRFYEDGQNLFEGAMSIANRVSDAFEHTFVRDEFGNAIRNQEEQLQKNLSHTFMQAWESATEWADKRSHESPGERGRDIGKVVPAIDSVLGTFAFFSKKNELLPPNHVRRQGLDMLSDTELTERGITKKPISALREEDIANPIDRNASAQEKVNQLLSLTKENEPHVEAFAAYIDLKYGTKSEISIKDPIEVLKKAERPGIKSDKPWFNVEHIRDSFRFRTSVDNLEDLPRIAKELKDSGFEIIKAEPEKLLAPKGRGWRIAPFDLRAPNGQLIEYYVLPKEMNDAGKTEHSFYERWRDKSPETMPYEEILLREDSEREAKKIHNKAWDSYLRRTNQTEEHVAKLIQQTTKSLEDR